MNHRRDFNRLIKLAVAGQMPSPMPQAKSAVPDPAAKLNRARMNTRIESAANEGLGGMLTRGLARGTQHVSNAGDWISNKANTLLPETNWTTNKIQQALPKENTSWIDMPILAPITGARTGVTGRDIATLPGALADGIVNTPKALYTAVEDGFRRYGTALPKAWDGDYSGAAKDFGQGAVRHFGAALTATGAGRLANQALGRFGSKTIASKTPSNIGSGIAGTISYGLTDDNGGGAPQPAPVAAAPATTPTQDNQIDPRAMEQFLPLILALLSGGMSGGQPAQQAAPQPMTALDRLAQQGGVR